MIVGIEKLTPGGSNGDVLDHMPEQFGALYQSAYEAGYRQGFHDGFTDGAELRKKDNGRAALQRPVALSALQDSESKKSGRALVVPKIVLSVIPSSLAIRAIGPPRTSFQKRRSQRRSRRCSTQDPI
jgi:hypothetical protein